MGLTIAMSRATGSPNDRWALLRLLRNHRSLLRTLSSPFYEGVLESSPSLRQQYLKSYLARSLPLASRAAAVTANYDFFRERMTPGFYRHLLAGPLELWRNVGPASDYRLLLQHNHAHFYEGDLVLALCRRDVLLFQVSFSVIPGRLVGAAEERVVFVGGAQGAVPERGELQPAVRANGGVAPSHLVMAALQGVAAALSVGTVIGVGNAEQLLKTRRQAAAFSFDYDEFWAMFGAARNRRGFSALAVPFQQPSLDRLSAPHRRRSRRKRAFKAEVQEAARAMLVGYRASRPFSPCEGSGRQPVAHARLAAAL